MTSSDPWLDHAEAQYKRHARFIVTNWKRLGKPASLIFRLNPMEPGGERMRVHYHIAMLANWQGYRWVEVGVSFDGVWVERSWTIYIHVPAAVTGTA